jgi:squid-like protein
MRLSDVKQAKAKPGKIYVGGLPEELTEDAIRDYFTTNFGTVSEIESPYDKERQRRKNFCFVTFEREEVLKEVLANSRQKIGEHTVDVKKASPRPKMPPGGGPWGPYHNFYGGYGMPYGGYYDYGGYYGGWGGGGGAEAGGEAASGGGETAAGGGKMSRESGGARVTPY